MKNDAFRHKDLSFSYLIENNVRWSNDFWMGVWWNWVFDTSLRNILIVMMRTVRKVVDAILQKDFNLSVLLLIVSSESVKILWKLSNFDAELTVLVNNNCLLFDHCFNLSLKMSHFNQEFFFDNRFLYVDRILDWNFDRNFNYFLNLYRFVNINGFIYVNRSFNYFWSWNFNCFNDFLDNFNRNLFLNLDIFGNLYNFLDNNFLDNLFRNSTV